MDQDSPDSDAPLGTSNPFASPADTSEETPLDLSPLPESLPHPQLGWAILWWLGMLIIQVGVGILIAAFLVTVLRENLESLADYASVMAFLSTLTFAVVAVGIVLILFRTRAARVIGLRGLSPQQWVLVLLAVFPIQILASEVTNVAHEFLPQLNAEMLEGLIHENLLFLFFGVCLFPAVGEEIFFRGFLSRGLVAHYGVFWGTLITALLFGAMHVDPVQASGAFVLGIVLQFIFLATRSITGVIVMHMLNNFFAFLAARNVDVFPIPGLSVSSDDGIVHTPIVLLLAAGAASITLLVLFYQTRTHWVLPNGERWSPGYVTAQPPPAAVAARAVSPLPNFGISIVALASYASFVAAVIWASSTT